MAWATKQGKYSYQLKASIGYNKDGKQKTVQKTIKHHPTMTENQIKKWVEKEKILFQEEIDNRTFYGERNLTLNQFIELYFDNTMSLKSSTKGEYKKQKKRIIIGELGELKVGKIKPPDIQRFLNNLATGKRLDGKKGGLATKTIINYNGFLSSVFSWGVKMEYLSKNPCEVVTIPNGKESKEREIYTDEEIRQILKILIKETSQNLQNALYFILLIYTGARKGEISALKWSDIDFENNLISINKAFCRNEEGKLELGRTKTKKSNRFIRISPDITTYLSCHLKKQREYSEKIGNKWIRSDFIFASWCGDKISINTMSKWWKKLCESHNIRYLSQHSFRHLYASTLIGGGENIKAVSEALGHSNATTTLNIYTHEYAAAEAKVRQTLLINSAFPLPRKSSILYSGDDGKIENSNDIL